MLAHNTPRAAVAVQPQDARETLEVVVHEGVIQPLRGFFARRRHDAMPWEKGELGTGAGAGSGRGQRRWMHTQPAHVAHDEACGRESGAGEAQERVLWVRFEGDAVME